MLNWAEISWVALRWTELSSAEVGWADRNKRKLNGNDQVLALVDILYAWHGWSVLFMKMTVILRRIFAQFGGSWRAFWDHFGLMFGTWASWRPRCHKSGRFPRFDPTHFGGFWEPIASLFEGWNAIWQGIVFSIPFCIHFIKFLLNFDHLSNSKNHQKVW